MDDVNTLFRKLVNAQSAAKQEVLGEIQKSRKEMNDRFDKSDKQNAEEFKEVKKRLDKQGHQLAVLDDDAPSGVEFNKLKKRVDTLEQKIAS